MPELVELKGGLIVDGLVIRGLVDLENRGCIFRVEDGLIFIEPRASVTAEDAAWITANRLQVLGILGYELPV